MTEIWKPVPDPMFSPLYLVSSLGRVRSLDQIIKESTGFERQHKGRLITPKKTGLYLGVSLFHQGSSKRYYLHRLVATLFVPNPENRPCVNHLNLDRRDNRAENLEWVTYKENTRHYFESSKYVPPKFVIGESCHSAKLNEEKVRYLRLHWKPGQSITKLSKDYGITSHALYKVLRGSSWKHVDPPVAIHWPREKSDS